MTKLYALIVEDDKEMAAVIKVALQYEDYSVEIVAQGDQALAHISQRKPDLLVLDIMLPEVDGITICRTLRSDEEYNDMPILFISARTQTNQVVEGLDVGADDYITKPFEIDIFRARIRAIRRREERSPVGSKNALHDETVLQVGELELDSEAYVIRTPDRTSRLTATEHRLLRYMMEHAENVLSAWLLLEDVWAYPPETGDPDLVRAHMRKLRTKIESDPNDPQYIHTVHGVGYMIVSQAANQ